MRTDTFLALLLAVPVLACDSDGSRGPQAVGGGCDFDANCQPGLTCELRVCHQPCVADGECAGEARCTRRGVLDDAGTRSGVCQLLEDIQCEHPADCPGRQLCGYGECRDDCSEDTDCLQGQRCVDERFCFSTDPNKDSAP